VLLFLQDNLKATPETLGDARKETPEELAERHERVVAASLLALSSLLDLLVSKQQHESATGMCRQRLAWLPACLHELMGAFMLCSVLTCALDNSP